MHDPVDSRRCTPLNAQPIQDGPIIYWMSRDQRAHDNWALLYAQELALARRQSLLVVFALTPTFLGATIRQYDFLLRGLEESAKELARLDIPFVLLHGSPEVEVPAFAQKVQAGAVVTEFDPLRIKKKWQSDVAGVLKCALIEVDAHNIVPCRFISNKQEYGAYTLRPKIQRALPEFLTLFPRLQTQAVPWQGVREPIDWERVRGTIQADTEVPAVSWLRAGAKAGHDRLADFIQHRLEHYDARRNDPTLSGQSDLSPYLHYGHLSAQRVALAVQSSELSEQTKAAFLEELIVRRELADNFCHYNQNYDKVVGFPVWAQKSLAEHQDDAREFVYTQAQFAKAQTHDPLWNAAQLQMVHHGKMHGYMRMYWAKKILEWSTSPEQALQIAIQLNDRYELDGRDPSGYAGIAWSIGGVHDRAWFERPVYGKIRYMNANGCAKKFKVKTYIEQYGKDLA